MTEAFIFGAEIMEFFYGIALSTIAASIFYLFQVVIPDRKRKRIIKNNFKQHYTQFKESSIFIFLSALGRGADFTLVKKLLILEEFKHYFKEEINDDGDDGDDRWHSVINGMNEKLLKDLIIELEVIYQEIEFFLNNTYIEDEEIFAFFKRFKSLIHPLKSITPSEYYSSKYDEMKHLSQFLWELFAGWSWVKNYRTNDLFEEMLNKA